MKFPLLYTEGFDPAPIAKALAAEEIDARIVQAPRDLTDAEPHAVLVLDPRCRAAFPSGCCGP